ncbi:MAG: Gfo/Idh/MocA family oxidoreductase [Candidatus Bathyarchaeota archaeon]|nr:Gfo/Idh/MocA family oxidoreductase [Candidatus Bathyarchaeota archaeon]
MNVGLVGCGRVSEIHMNAYKYIPEVKVVSVSDINLEKAEAFAQKHRIEKAYDDVSKLFELKDLDFVDICTPTSTHVTLACEAAKFGHNILLEKPMARNTKECDQIIHEVSKHKVKLCVCHNQLFIPHIMRMKKMVDSGEFDLIYLNTSVKTNPTTLGPAAAWVGTPEQGGILWEEGLHLAYLQLHFLRDINEVLALGKKIEYPIYDNFHVLLRTAGKAIGVMEVSWFAKRPEASYEFMSHDGRRIQIIEYRHLLDLSKLPSNFLQGLYSDCKAAFKKWVGPIVNGIRMRGLIKCLHHYNLITAFISSIKNDEDPPVTPEDGRSAIHLLECIQESLDTNKLVKVK